ncbi:ABC transporter ATP-binding protein [Streptomyces hesseae]|uniref:ABC transporter ATP-binding protein n=1 Tax=Streptomyces hesseae TaxID=3075519 RepID=A0ABU2SIG1_9ACTN|nr:ABC transporter ATP-binding protein [Streptomyces sp. DSM 40473]MDT0448764.1 ABC transporter ATP-binding protein [Streptomyces sp. DSM 40473]
MTDHEPTAATAPTAALAATGLGRKFRGGWGLRDCAFTLPAGRVTALVGPNGAGKSTLLHLATGLLRPTTGDLRVFGAVPGTPEALRRIAFVAQDKPLYPRFSVKETLRFGRRTNPEGWDQNTAEALVRAGDIPLRAQVGTLSPGQCTRIALALALGKRPDLLLLDEPLAALDPLVRHEVMALIMAEVAERGISVVMSSHVLSELENVCDHVLLLKHGGVRLTGDAQRLREEHLLITGRAHDGTPDGLPPGTDRATVVEATVTGRQVSALVRHGGTGPGDRWVTQNPTLEELLLAYLRTDAPAAPAEEAAA